MADARRRERRFRENARDKRDRGETLLASLFERSADAQAALALLAEGLADDDQHDEPRPHDRPPVSRGRP